VRRDPPQVFVKPSVHCQTLRRAYEILGSREVLRDFLNVQADQLEDWLLARATPPLSVFLRAVDVVVARAVVDAHAHHASPGDEKSSMTPAAFLLVSNPKA
jgi:hypothetical protein